MHRQLQNVKDDEEKAPGSGIPKPQVLYHFLLVGYNTLIACILSEKVYYDQVL